MILVIIWIRLEYKEKIIFHHAMAVRDLQIVNAIERDRLIHYSVGPLQEHTQTTLIILDPHCPPFT